MGPHKGGRFGDALEEPDSIYLRSSEWRSDITTTQPYLLNTRDGARTDSCSPSDHCVAQNFEKSYQNVNTPQTTCIAGSHIRGGSTWSIKLSAAGVTLINTTSCSVKNMNRTWYHPHDIAAGEDGVDLLQGAYELTGVAGIQ